MGQPKRIGPATDHSAIKDVAGLRQPNRPYGLCFGVLASRVEINCSAAGGTATAPDRTILLAGIFLPYTRRLSPLSGRIVEPLREIPANKPRAPEVLKNLARRGGVDAAVAF